MNRVLLQRRWWLLPLALWSALVGLSAYTNIQELNRHAEELATNRGRFVFKMVESMRLWNARHGGVYAPVTEQTVPNPHLEVDERDIATPSGRPLTLLNPAYMTRQISEVVLAQSGMATRLTSLKPLNPDNRPDDWEAAALRAFEAGEKEVSEFLEADGELRFRYMAPLVTKEACLKCHAHQGYRLGDVRGGISVAFAASPLLAATDAQRLRIALLHGAVWLLVAGVTLLALLHNRRHLLRLEQAKGAQDALVAVRTRELREEVAERELAETRLRLLLESSGEGIYGVDAQGRCTFCNPTALRLFGLESAEPILGKDIHELVHGRWRGTVADSSERCPLVATYRLGTPAHVEAETFWRADGSALAVEYRSQPLYDNGRLVGAVVTFADITERRAREDLLRKLSAAVRHSPESILITDREGRIEYVNERFCEVTGYRSEEVIGLNPRLFQSGQTPKAAYEQMWDTILAGKVWQGELLNRKRNGELYWESVSISPITDDRGEISHFVGVKTDITERRQLQEQIWQQANYDQLTGLVNRRLFHDRLEQLLSNSRRNKESFALLFVDLDRFKQINDTFGHEAGDELLRQVASRLAGSLRQTDTAARVGGDEFTVMLPRVGQPFEAKRVADKILASLSIPFGLRENEVAISASIGIALYPRDGDDIETLLQHADAAMYRVKTGGRNGSLVYGEEPVVED